MKRIYFNLYLSNKKNNNWNWHRECYYFNQMIVRGIPKNPFYIFFRFFNLQTQSTDAQFYSSSKWLKKVQLCFYVCNLHTKQHLKPYTCSCGFLSLGNNIGKFWAKTSMFKKYLHFDPQNERWSHILKKSAPRGNIFAFWGKLRTKKLIK